MKNHPLYSIIGLGLIVVFTTIHAGNAKAYRFTETKSTISATLVQNANAVLDQVHSKYQDSKLLKINFSLAFKNGNSTQYSAPEKGEIWVSSPTDQYKIVMANNEYISDGKSQWAILKDIEEIQITDVDRTSAGQIAPSNLFSFFQKGFTSKIVKSETIQNKNVWNIELHPEKSNMPYQKVIIRVVKNTNEIHDITVFDKNKGEMRYSILSVQKPNQLEPSLFKFNKADYKNMEIVDLR